MFYVPSDVKGQLSTLMLYKISVFVLLVKWSDDGSILQPKLVDSKTFTGSLLCVTGHWITTCICDLTNGDVYVCLHSAVVIANRHRLYGPGIESRMGRDFPNSSRPALGPTQSPIKWVPGVFPQDKAVRTWRCPPTPSSAEIKERLELYL